MRIINSFLPWNGTYIGNYQHKDVIGIVSVSSRKYKLLTVRDDCGIICTLHRYTSNFPIIADTLLTAFGIRTVGMHLAIINNVKYYILQVPIGKNGEIIWEPSITKLQGYQITTSIQMQMEKILILCNILGFRKITGNCFRIRYENDIAIVVPEIFTDYDSDAEKFHDVIPKALSTKWIKRGQVDSLFHEYFIPQGYEVGQFLHAVSEACDKIIKWYDNKNVEYNGYIMSRLSSRV